MYCIQLIYGEMSLMLIGRPLTERNVIQKMGSKLTAVLESLQITPKNMPKMYP